ncbi:MAG: sigma-70 family RNA polymerase sigma factor [Planctomycetes bacterium]|nr:sigma-70 family RNA polymerase sigma factor [Planctomycetota bacterium]
MEKNLDYVQLVTQAQLGDKECLNRLAEAVRERLYAYVYRYTLSDALTQDIVQESILKMLEVLNELKEADRFWPWLFKIALNKVLIHRRAENKRRTVSKPVAGLGDLQRDRQTAIANVVGQELKEIVLAAMQKLKPEHRAVINMRCYDEMAYAEIAKTIGCSEFAAQMLFYRAKKSLKKQLARSGFGKGSLLMALVLFGKVTATSDAAAAGVSVTAATTKVGLAAGLAAAVSSKALVVSLTTAGVLAVGTMVTTSALNGTTDITENKPATSSQVTGQANQAVGEYWYFFPEGAGRAVMMQQITQSGRKWLQDEFANYYNHKDTISIRNHRCWHSDLSVWRLPTDGPELTDFLSRVEGRSVEMEYVAGKGGGLLVIASSRAGQRNNWITRHYNVMDEDYFQSDWPKGTPTIDRRDPMHKRGWTYFKITGQINGKEARGMGRIPFVYAANRRHWPWVVLKVGENIVSQACFAGLSRPWMGLHTIDTVRRNAAQKQIWFETKYDKPSGKAEVVLKPKDGQIVYTIDMEKDVVESIAFAGEAGGQLQFDYLQEIDSIGSEFAPPAGKASMPEKSRGMLWLLELISNN